MGSQKEKRMPSPPPKTEDMREESDRQMRDANKQSRAMPRHGEAIGGG